MKKCLIMSVLMLFVLAGFLQPMMTIAEEDDEFIDQQQTYHQYGCSYVVNASQRLAQSFIPQFDTITRIELYCYNREQTPTDTNIVVSIRQRVDGDDLCSIEKQVGQLPKQDENDGGWVSFDIQDLPVTIGTVYYIVCQQQPARAVGGIMWNAVSINGLYSSGVGWKNHQTDEIWETTSGDFCFKTFGVNLVNRPPFANAGGPYYAKIEEDYQVTFSAAESYDLDGNIVSYTWDFGDGSTGHGQTVVHSFDPTGQDSTIVNLTVYDNDRNVAWDQAMVYFEYANTVDPPLVKLLHPTGDEILIGSVLVKWYAIDGEHPGTTLPMLLYYKRADASASSWTRVEEDPIPNTGEYEWNLQGISEGEYVLLLEAIGAQAIGHDSSDPFIIGSGAGMSIAASVKNTDHQRVQYVRDGDSLIVSATISGAGASKLAKEDITADLSCFGKGTAQVAGSYNGHQATWSISDIICNPGDGLLPINIQVRDVATGSTTVYADNTAPDLTFEKPLDGFYFFNGQLLPLSGRTIIIGPCDVEVDIVDTGKIDRVVFYINDNQMKSIDQAPFEWYMNERISGSVELKAIAIDMAGNTGSVSKTITIHKLLN